MSDRDWTPADRVAVFLMGGAFLLFSALYFSTFSLRGWLWENAATTDRGVIGSVESLTGRMQRQTADSHEFRTISPRDALKGQDVVVTGDQSQALLDLGSLGKVELGPNSLVRLVFQSQFRLGGVFRVAEVRVVAGTVKVYAKEKGAIVIREPEARAAVSSSVIEVKPITRPSPRGAPSIAVAPSIAPPTLAWPKDRQVVKSTGPTQNVILTWSKTRSTEKYEVQVAKDAEFQDVLVSDRLRLNFKKVPDLSPGNYFWRVRALPEKGDPSEFSGANSFRVVATPRN